MEPQTNNVMDLRTFGRMFLGRQPGQPVSKEEFEADKKAYEYYVKQAIDQRMSAPEQQQAPQFMSLTNADGRVVDVLVKPDGTTQVVEPKTINTQQGMFTMSNPTNAAPIVDPRTQQQVMGYAADPMIGDAPQTIGQYGAGQAPSPSPSPSPTPSNMPMQFRSAEEVKAAYRSNAISREQAVGILANQFGIR